jgi:hypothetical protein
LYKIISHRDLCFSKKNCFDSKDRVENESMNMIECVIHYDDDAKTQSLILFNLFVIVMLEMIHAMEQNIKYGFLTVLSMYDS